jgi:hypothetical protein
MRNAALLAAALVAVCLAAQSPAETVAIVMKGGVIVKGALP